ncbi:MAG: DUF3320 domain-containing protein [Clostridiales bacterium]|nr:DUF3320 domain-containing protein [Clostridiales bacterium]MDY6117007.1 DUF3320 domain-containing protein [Anaerovoracaceae bacterium]
MAKNCSICGKKLGLLKGKIVISDGLVCTSCWIRAGLDMGLQSMYSAKNRTTKQLKDMIDIEILKTEAEKSGLKKPHASAKSNSQRLRNPQNIAENIKAASAAKKAGKTPQEQKPIDIMLAVDKKKRVDFCCEGQPVINFDDLVNGKEMIIGDGFINNDSKTDLPEVRIACEFDPPIIDPGLIYYEAGTFSAGLEGRFEIDDPPINLEEYSKIKRTRNGKARFTLFIEEQEIHTEECLMKIKPAPADDMKKLINTVMYEDEKNASGPVNVFLYATKNGKFDMDLMRHPELLYSMYSNGQEQLIGDVFVSNESGKALKNIQFEAKFTSNILSPISVFLGDVPAGENISFEVDDPTIDVDKLEMLTEIETCTATYKLLVNGKVAAESTGRITICPYNQWNAALILLPAYMTPNHPNIISVLKNASKWMLVNGMNPSLEGYQSDAKRVEQMIGAVYNAVKESNIIYSNPPASFFGPQRIRLCETVFEEKFATCMDMTILFASCLESFGLHPILITAPGHIFAGVWLNSKGRLQEPVLSDAKLIQKYIEDGQLVAVECTAMNVGKDISYTEAKKIANKTIKAIADNNIPDHECIDVQIARSMGIRPLPIRVPHANQSFVPMSEHTEVKTKARAKKQAQENKAIEEVEKSTKPTEVEKSVQPKEVNIPITKEPEHTVDNASSENDVVYFKETYKTFDEDLSYISIDNFYDRQSKKVIKDAIVQIVTVEGPISQPALIKTLINTTSLGRASKQITEHLDKLVAAADVKITRQSGVRFLWNQGTDPTEYVTYRIREQRNPEDISKYELKNAVCYLIQENGPMTKDEITKAMIEMFGYNRSSSKIVSGANDAIKAARELKAIEQIEGNRFSLNRGL